MEKCAFCGYKNNPAVSEYTPDLNDPDKFYYRCNFCGRENVIINKKYFVDISGLKGEIRQNIQNRKQQAINTDILKDLDKNLQAQTWEAEREMKRRHPIPRTWGTSRINCTHTNIETKNGITYCKSCGKNLGEEFNTESFQNIDKQLGDIFTQEADILDYEARLPKGKERLGKNPFMYRGELE